MKSHKAIILCSLLVFSISIPIASGNTPEYGDYEIVNDSRSDFSEHGFFLSSDSSCEDTTGSGGSIICDANTKEVLYSISWYRFIFPMMYNDTILLVNGEQGRPDFGEKNHIYGLNINTWSTEFTINSPWNDGGTVKSIKISPDKQYIAINRGSCIQIWDMNIMANSKLFANFQGASNTYCTGARAAVQNLGEFSPDSSIYVGYEPADNTVSAFSTENWSKLGTVQPYANDQEVAREFIFASDGSFAYYIEYGGWDNNRRVKNKIFQIDLSVQSNLWDQSKHTEFFFGPSDLDVYDQFHTFSNHIVYFGIDDDGEQIDNRVVIWSIRSIPEYNCILLHVFHDEDYPQKGYPHDGIIMLSAGGDVLAESILQSRDGGVIDNFNVAYLDTDDDGTPDYLDGAPFDSRDTVDSDGDGTGDAADLFPNDNTQWSDTDGDGYGDNMWGNNSDQFPEDATQWNDSDGDGYGDNPEGYNRDFFPENPSQWNDSDGDGYGDNPWGDRIDFFPNNPLRWADSDLDGVADEDDDCPNQVDGVIDLDGDGDCEGQDFDDDGDGFSDVMETRCGTFGNNSTSYPPDLDGDYICDDRDDDLDGDGVSNEADIFPLDGTEWNDLDNDGFGNNSDDCVGNYGTSTLDRLGCIDQDGDGVSDLNDDYPYDPERGYELYDDSAKASNSESNYVSFTLAIVAMLAIAGFGAIKIFRKGDEVVGKNGQATEKMDVIVTSENIFPTSTNEAVAPSFSIKGEQHENGHEVLEFPEGSGIWWWKNYDTEQWVFWYQ